MVGVDLKDFTVKIMTEIYGVDDKGGRVRSYGFLEDAELAEGFVEAQMNSKDFRTRECSVLTDGKNGFLLNVEPVHLKHIDTAEEAVLEKARAKLSPLEIKIARKYL